MQIFILRKQTEITEVIAQPLNCNISLYFYVNHTIDCVEAQRAKRYVRILLKFESMKKKFTRDAHRRKKKEAHNVSNMKIEKRSGSCAVERIVVNRIKQNNSRYAKCVQ